MFNENLISKKDMKNVKRQTGRKQEINDFFYADSKYSYTACNFSAKLMETMKYNCIPIITILASINPT